MKKYVVGTGGVITFAVVFMILLGSGATINHDGDKICYNKCVSYITISNLQEDVLIENFSALSPSFSERINKWEMYVLDNGEWVRHTEYYNFTFIKGETYTFKLVGYKDPQQNVKWALDVGELSLDPWWNATDITVSVNNTEPIQTDILNCSVLIGSNDSTSFNASYIWYVNNTLDNTWDTTVLNQIGNTTGTNQTVSLNSTYLQSYFKCCVNLSNSTTSTGYLCSDNVLVSNFNYSFPSGIDNISMTCLQPYMNNTEPEGQTYHIPLFNISARSLTQNLTNITIKLNQSLPAGFSIYASDYPQKTNDSINLSTTSQVILKTLSGTNYTESYKGIWLFGVCNNVTDNQTNLFNITIGGGVL